MKEFLIFAVAVTAAGLCAAQKEIDPGLPLGPYGRGDSIAQEFSMERAARFLDEVATNWGNRKGCVTCHTNGYYLTAPVGVFGDRPAYREVRAFAERFVGTWDENPPETHVLVGTAAFLAMNDAERNQEPSLATRRALDRAWARQSDEGHWSDWLKCNWPPFESDDHYGVTLMAIAMGMSKESYRNSEPARSGVARILRYLKEHPPTHIHQKGMLLWAAAFHDGLIAKAERDLWTSELTALQREDGGWASGDLGSWRQRDGKPAQPRVHVESDGYGTGFVLFVLMQAGIPSSDPRIQRGISWLESHQRIGGYWWTQSLRNEPDTSNFLTHTGTTFALKALVAARGPAPSSKGTRSLETTQLENGVLPARWPNDEGVCDKAPPFHVHPYNETFLILRQSGCTNFEKPFLYVVIGSREALLVDTGAPGADVSAVVDGLLRARSAGRPNGTIPLLVLHSHGHEDHAAGDVALRARTATTVVDARPDAISEFFRIEDWPRGVARYDLGDRPLDIVPIPGHEAASIAIYDRRTGILLTGDTLYPGRLYVRDAPAFAESIERLIEFTRSLPIAHVLGAHIENARRPFLDYPQGTKFQPEEHELELGRAHLLELQDALVQMGSRLERRALRDFTVWPIRP